MNNILIVSAAAHPEDPVWAYGHELAQALQARVHHMVPPERQAAVLVHEEARRTGAGLIVTGRETTRGIAHILPNLGMQTLVRGTCPVLMIPPGATFKPVRQIMYATSFEEDGYRIPPSLEKLADLLKSRITSVYINTDRMPNGLYPRTPVLEEVTRMELDPSNVFFYTLRFRHVLQGLLWLMGHYPLDIIALTPGKRMFYLRLLGQSLTHSMARRTKIPLLSIPTA
ncbi:MAG: hypothetical protein SF053_20665 [Bacteroidia bacterium]|nr:hypothetical protein [Bacteroidia bacterium]